MAEIGPSLRCLSALFMHAYSACTLHLVLKRPWWDLRPHLSFPKLGQTYHPPEFSSYFRGYGYFPGLVMLQTKLHTRGIRFLSTGSLLSSKLSTRQIDIPLLPRYTYLSDRKLLGYARIRSFKTHGDLHPR